MKKALVTILLLTNFFLANCQLPPAVVVVHNYSTAQKRLLVTSTINFINFKVEGLDKDSIAQMACQITGMPFLLLYNEGFEDKTSGGEEMINGGKIAEARALLRHLSGEQRIQMLLELSIRYLHRPGRAKPDLDSAQTYLDAAALLLIEKKDSWQTESQFLQAEIWVKRENDSAANRLLRQIAVSCERRQDSKNLARVWQLQGKRLAAKDPARLTFFQKALELAQKMNFKEKEIELLWDFVDFYNPSDMENFGNSLHRILLLQNSSGFLHSLYAQNVYAYVLLGQTKFIEALDTAKAAVENMDWSGFNALAGSFYDRLGTVYACLGKEDDCLAWYRKALNTRKKETHIFWYKSLFILTTEMVAYLNKAHEALALMDSITVPFPPISVWEKMQILSIKGSCYEQMTKPRLADRYYTKLYDLAESDRSADPHGEFTQTYLMVAQFYIHEHNLANAHRFIQLAGMVDREDYITKALKYAVLFSIDSMEGKYRSALQDRILYKWCTDLYTGMDQRKQMDAMTVKYEAETKDKNIRLLNQQAIVQQAAIAQNRLAGNMLIAGGLLLLVIIGLLLSQFRLKQRATKEMNKKNASLQKLAEEKEWLLKEVNYRVKQNLHTISCLLESQADSLQADAQRAVENSRHRIHAMSLLHQKLYESDIAGYIEMSRYLPEFIRYLDESFDAHFRIEFKLDIRPVKLGIPQAIPVALIINEAVTNSIKYAFPEKAKGVITISMQQDADLVKLVVADNGIGFDEPPARSITHSLGLKLMKGLSEDINASVRWENTDGTRITLEFRAEPLIESPAHPEK